MVSHSVIDRDTRYFNQSGIYGAQEELNIILVELGMPDNWTAGKLLQSGCVLFSTFIMLKYSIIGFENFHDYFVKQFHLKNIMNPSGLINLDGVITSYKKQRVRIPDYDIFKRFKKYTVAICEINTAAGKHTMNIWNDGSRVRIYDVGGFGKNGDDADKYILKSNFSVMNCII